MLDVILKIFSVGSDGQFGEVKVKPLSVPPSIGPTYAEKHLWNLSFLFQIYFFKLFD